jgi:hypothetical protein
MFASAIWYRMLRCLVEFLTMVLFTIVSAGIFWFAGT